MKRRVAIVIVNYNTFLDTRECVESLKKASRQVADFTVVVVDNASTQVDPEHEAFLQVNTIYLRNQENKGFSGGNNIGIKYAIEQGYDYVLLLNNDTVVEPDFLDELVTRAENKGEFGIAIGKIYYDSDRSRLWYAGGTVNMKLGMVYQRGFNELDVGQWDTEEEVQFVTGCMMLIPVDVIRKVGLLEESFFLYAEDLEYSLRMTQNGYKMYYIPSSVIYHKVGASSGRENVSSNTQYYMVRNQLYCMRSYQKGFYGKVGLCYNTLRYIKYILQKRYSLKVVIEAYLDCFKGKVGKR